MIEIRQVEAFEEVAMEALAGPIFGDAARQQYLSELIGPEADERNKALRTSLPKPERIRMAAFDGERFVGCSSGWFEFGGNFYIGLSAVDPAYRQRGIYTRLLNAIEQAVRERGGLLISSHHVATNNAVLIAKLKLGPEAAFGGEPFGARCSRHAPARLCRRQRRNSAGVCALFTPASSGFPVSPGFLAAAAACTLAPVASATHSRGTTRCAHHNNAGSP
jgi:GNAT superfamily N-acetyltransferase